ncbi:MAG TPA: uracil-DNA glycosylase [Armatimonadota bacterium]|nr:uracil-DNA glycosylase [Armatimonadota bacterium]
MTPEGQLNAVARSVRRCRRCRLWRSRARAVPGEGAARARIVFIGEAPGRAEDESGRPFQGMAGREFDQLLRRAGLRREDIFVTGVNKCRPPGNRRPRRDEMDACRRAHLDRQLAAIAPRLVVLMGGVAVEAMLGRPRLRGVLGRVVERDGRRYFVTYHPAAAMRFPAAGRSARRHFARLPAVSARAR